MGSGSGILRIAALGIPVRRGLRHGGTGGGGGHGGVENVVADVVTHLLHGGFFAVERDGHLLFAPDAFAGADDHPIFLVDVPKGTKGHKKEYKDTKEDVTPLDAEAVGQRFEPPFNEFEHSFEPDLHG